MFEKIKSALEERDVPYQEDGTRLEVEPADNEGFSVWACEDEDSWIVGYDGWHEHFDDPEEAFACFGLGLSDECRLQVRLSGDHPYRWTIETVGPDGQWSAGSTVGLIFFPFWRSRKVVIRQNRWNEGR